MLISYLARALAFVCILVLMVYGISRAATYYFIGVPIGGAPALINQSSGTTAQTSTAAVNPTTPGIDPTNVTYGAKGDARGSGVWFGTNPATTLASSATSGATTISVVSALGFPTSGNYMIYVDQTAGTQNSPTTAVEEMLVTGGQGTTTWTVTRAQGGTAASAHAGGVKVIGYGDGSWNYNDSSCGTIHRCFSSPSGAFTSADVGKVISVNGIATIVPKISGAWLAGTTPFVQTAYNTFVTVTSVQSATQLTLSAIPTISTANFLYSGLGWVMGTNDLAAFQSAVTAGDLHIPKRYYLMAPYTASGYPAGAASAVALPAYRDIWCDSGATFIDVAFDNFDNGNTAVFFSNYNGNQNYRNCTFDGTNVGPPGAPSLNASGTSYQAAIEIYAVDPPPGPSNFYIMHNSFNYWWGQQAIMQDHPSSGDYAINIQVIENSFTGCALYGFSANSGQYGGSLFNTLTDCSVGPEPGGATAANPSQNNYTSGNTLTCIYSDGVGETYITGMDAGSTQSGANIVVFDNYASGISPQTGGYCGYDAFPNGGPSPAVTYRNNQNRNGAGWH